MVALIDFPMKDKPKIKAKLNIDKLQISGKQNGEQTPQIGFITKGEQTPQINIAD